MIDEEVLSNALRDVAEAFHISDAATDRILAQAETSTATPSPLDAPGTNPRKSRRGVLIAAAVIALVVGGITASVATVSGHSSNSAGPTLAPYRGAPHSTPVRGAPGVPEAGSAGGTLSAGSGTAAGSSKSSASAPPSKSGSPIPPGSVGQSAKVEANGSVDLTIADGTLQSVLGKLTILASAEGGFVASTQAQLGAARSGSSSTGVVVLRVPEANFAVLVTQVQRYGHPTSVTTTSQDVTGQYVNLQAQIAALQSSRQQYLTIMTRASSIGDILAVQSQLDTIQSEIDQLQGQLNVLDNETTYGSLTVSLSEVQKSPPPAPRPRPQSSGLLRAWDKSVGGFVAGIEWIVRIAGPLLLVLICLAGLLLLGRLSWRVARRRML